MQPLFPQQQERFSTSQTHSHHPQHQSSATHLNSDLHSSHTLNDHVLQQQQHGSPPIIIAAQPRNHLSGPNTNYSSTGKLKSTSHYGQRYNPVLATTPSSSVITASSNPPVYSQVSVSQSAELGQGITFVSQNDAQQPHLLPQTYTPNSGVQASAANPPAVGSSGVGTRQHLVPSVRSHDLLVPHWSPAPIQPYGRNYETKNMSETDFIAQTTTAATSASISTTVNHQALATNNFYARSLHTPFFQMGLPLAEEGHFSYSTQGSSVPAVMNPVMQPVGNLYLPAFDVKAYTFRKKSRHYVAVKHKNALRIEPIIYLKTSILDPHREIVRNWDYLRFSIHRFKENAFPKKKLSMEEMRTARILDVNISLVSPNNNNRPIEESCPACVMRMDGERKIMQVLAKNFKMTHLGEPVIDIRKGHAIVCIKLNCYCDHHNEHEGFVVRMQTEPEVVQVGGSVKLRICCEARSKGGPTEVEAEEEEGLTDIDAPVSTGSRSPLPLNDQSVQSPSLSYGSQSPDPRTHRQRQPSSNSSSTGSPRSVDERPISSVGVDPSTTTTNGSGGRGRGVVAPPKFRQIYPLTPSEGTCLGGTRVTIHGANFDTMQNPAVYFGKVPAELVTISHHDVMECTTPPAEGLKPGIVAVRIVSSTFPLGAENDSVDYMYMAPLDYDFYNLAATSLSYAMSNEYPNEDSLSYILNAHGTGMGAGLGLAYGSESFSGNNADIGLAWAAKEDVVLDFLRVIQTLAPGRILPAFKTESGCTLLHLAAYHGMIRLTKELLAMGIDHTALDRNHKSALHFAQLSSHAEVARILSEARIPPRPMVPRLGTASGSNSIRPPTVKAVADLVQKHETTLRGAVVQHQEAKAKELDQMRERSLHIMGIRGRTTSTDISNLSISTDIDGDDIAMFSGESSPSTKSFDGDEEHIRSPSLSSMPSPPRKDNSQKRKVGDDELPQLASGALKRPSKERTNDFMTSSLSDARLAFIQNGVKEWESINRLKLPRDVSKLTGPIPEMDVQVWVCESAAVSMIVSDSTASDASLPPILTSSESTFTALALSTNGIHLYLEQQNGSVMRDSPSKKLQHWNLIEIDALKSVSNELEDTLTIDMCGLVPRRGRDLSGERLSIKFNSVNGTASEVLKVIEASHGQSSNQQEAVSPAAWIQLQLKIHGALFNVNEGEVKSTVDDYLELKDGILTLKAPRTAGPRFSLGMIGAVFRVAQKLQSCTLVQFDGVQIVEDGWSRPELTKILEATVRSMKEVLQWRFNACGWTTSTVEAFVKGLEGAVVPKNKDNYHTQQSKSISLADNSFGGEDTVGHLLVGYFSKFRGFKALDLSNCDIGLAGMEALVNNLSGLTELRLQGNWADDRWWQWMDAVLENNRQIQLCSIGAPVPCSNPLQSVLSLERLESLENLVELDLAETIITQPTLDVLEAHVRQGSRKLQMLNLSHCQLNWLSLSSLFKAICDVNRSTKSTLNVSKNPLFDSDAAIQEWITSVEATKPQVPFGIQMMDLILSDVNLQRILAPLERATCFNELNVKGLYVTRPRQEAELQSLPYDEARAKAIPGGASKESCLALGRILTTNSTLIMLDVSGNFEKRRSGAQEDKPISASGSTTAPPDYHSVGGFGPHIALSFPALAKNSKLRVLSIDHNRFGEESLVELCEALRRNTTLGIFSCDGNDAFTPTGLETIAEIFAPPRVDAVAVKAVATPENGALSLTLSPAYNQSLSIWDLKAEEILTQMELLAREVQRHTAEQYGIEKLQAGKDVKFMGLTPLEDVKRQLQNAERNRIRYVETHARIIEAIKANNKQGKGAKNMS